MKVFKSLIQRFWPGGRADEAEAINTYHSKREKFLTDQKDQIEAKLEELNLYLADFEYVEFIMLAYNGSALILAGGEDLSRQTDFELKFMEVNEASLSKNVRLKTSNRSIVLDGYNEGSMIIKLADENGQAHIIECDGFAFKIIEGHYKAPFLLPRIKSLEKKVEAVNHFFAHSNINDSRVAYYDGHKLSLVGSFDLCYYHDIELLFMEVKKMDLAFFSGAGFRAEIPEPFLSLQRNDADSFKFSFTLDDQKSSFIICGDFDYKIGLVKYYDKKGRRRDSILF